MDKFLNKYGVNSTNNFQLLHYAKQLKIPNFTILMRDEIKSYKSNKLPINIITNIHTSKENGVHWSAFHIDKNNNKYFFDSFGLPPTCEIINKFKSNENDHILSSNFKIQKLGTSYCGQISLFVLNELNNNNKYESIILSL